MEKFVASLFKVNESSRSMLVQILEKCSLEELNKIPNGFSNNIIWNVGHVIAAQQGLVYRLSGLPLLVPDEFIANYKNGSKPIKNVSQSEVLVIKEYLSTTLSQTKADFEEGKFNTYTPLITSMGFTISCIEEGLQYNNFHEGTHLGIIMALRKSI